MPHEIKILGAGPAGLAAAIVLAQYGRRVIVYERSSHIGARFNDDFQGLENWSVEEDVLQELKASGINVDFFCKPFTGGNIYNPAYRMLKVSSHRNLFYLVKRGKSIDTLDTCLYYQALQKGVEVVFNHTYPINDINIMATGPRGVRAIAAGITFQTDLPDGAYATVGDYLSPKGYTYLLIANAKATLATVLFADFPKAPLYLQRTVESYIKLVGITVREPHYWGGYGNFNIPSTATKDGRLYVGEAAGFQDYLFGFGIRTALVSGILAAHSILNDISYDQLWKKRLLPTLRGTALSRGLYSKLGWIAYDLLWLIIGSSHDPSLMMRWLYTWGNRSSTVFLKGKSDKS
jgi:flavin-dependent dehydrogenase